LDTINRKIDTSFLCLVSNVTRVYLYVSCVQCYPYLSFCILCPMLPVSIFLCLVSNVTRICRSVSFVQCYPCLSFCILCPMLLVSIFLCILFNVTRICLSVSCVLCLERHIRVTLDTRHRKIDTCSIGQKTQKDRHGQH
jgi:hypothetical protein